MTTSGTGYKLFLGGNILYASEINDFLMNQSVMVFTNSGSRDAALPTPGDGQACYLTGNKVLQIYKTGTGWVNIGFHSDIRDSQVLTYMQAI